tara:strand:+ start:1312 stop:1542 length:231 start_codon:yes stop_codon:yes gene_type:complete
MNFAITITLGHILGFITGLLLVKWAHYTHELAKKKNTLERDKYFLSSRVERLESDVAFYVRRLDKVQNTTGEGKEA